MIILDCESLDSTLDSLGAIYQTNTKIIHEFFRSLDLDAHYETTKPLLPGDEEVRRLLEQHICRRPKPLARVNWFHLTRTFDPMSFKNGINPLAKDAEPIWSMLCQVFEGTPHVDNLQTMRNKGVPNFQYNLKVGEALHAGPFGMLVQEVADCASEIGNHDYLAMPEIIEDICSGYLVAYNFDLEPFLKQTLIPARVKFWSDQITHDGCLEAAIYYSYLASRDQRLTMNANTCFDGENRPIPPEQIINIIY